jgi:hypothetical protein
LSETPVGQVPFESPYPRPEAPLLDQRQVLKFFVPLAVSWIFMSLEGPITSGFISRRPGEENSLAGMALLMALSIFIESPVIDLLSTSTTLTRSHASYLQLRRFTGVMMLWTAVAHALVTLTPFYWVLVEGWMDTPHEVAVVLRPAMAIMVPWAACVGWRRFHHGILIRYGHTRPVGFGTTVRVASVFLIGGALFFLTRLPGLTLAAIALVGSVFTEAVFIHFVTQSTIRHRLDPMRGTDADEGISMGRLCGFHFPLTLATMTMILSMPLVTWALNNSPQGKTALAAWGIAMSVVFMFRSITFALPETVIALYKDEHTKAVLLSFCRNVGLWCSAAILAVYFSGVAQHFFERVLDSKPAVASVAAFALLSSVLIPAINAHASFLRGLLTAHHNTGARLWAIVASITALTATLGIGVALRANGILMIGVGMSVQIVAELAVLRRFWGRTLPSGDTIP